MFEAHFQSFEDRGERAASAPRVAALRAELLKRGLDGFIVPRAGRYLNEYVPPSDERLAWLTGFSGSAGIAIVLADRAAVFVDGRYQVQVREEIDDTIFAVEHVVENPPTLWIENNLPAQAKLGYSPADCFRSTGSADFPPRARRQRSCRRARGGKSADPVDRKQSAGAGKTRLFDP